MPRKIEVVEMPLALSESEACENIYNVPNRAWRKWNQQSRYIFNEVFNQMGDQTVVKHPLAPVIREELWKTIRWNAAWLAADAAWHSVQHESSAPFRSPK